MNEQITMTRSRIQFPPLKLGEKIPPQSLLPVGMLIADERWLYDILSWAQSQPDLHAAHYCHELGRQLLRDRRYRAAWPAFKTALVICSRQRPPCSPAFFAEMMSSLEQFLDEIIALPGASEYLERALVLWRQLRGSTHPETGELLNNLGYLYRQEGRLDEARDCYDQALAIWTQTLSSEHPHLVAAHNNLGAVARQAGRAEEAGRHYERALALSHAAYGADDPATAGILANLAAVHHDGGDDDAAIHCLQRAISLLEQATASAPLELAGAYNNLGHLLQNRGRYGQARKYLHRALDIYRDAQGTTVSELGTVLGNLAGLYRVTGEKKQALEALGCAYLLQRRTLGAQHQHTQATLEAMRQVASVEEDHRDPTTAISVASD